MRILVSGQFYPDSFARCVATTAEMMGHTIYGHVDKPFDSNRRGAWMAFCGAADRAFPSLEQRRERELCQIARKFQPDLILILSEGPTPDVIHQLKCETDARLAIWFPDHLANLGRQYMLAAEYDAWFFKEPYLVSVLQQKLGMNAHYLPEACHSRWHRRIKPSREDLEKYGCDLTTASNMYYFRARTLEIFENYDLKIWGANFPRWLSSPLRRRYPGVYVAEEQKSRAFNSAKIVLNTMHFAEIDGVNCRLFEAAGCGAFQIIDWKPALPDLFEPERELVTFRTRRELKDKVDFYLAHPEERQEIADRAYARAHREHTYEARLAKMFEILRLEIRAVAAMGVMIASNG
jgi:spore maturation protein CgeB